MKTNLDELSIDRNILGLDDIMLKKMLLAYSTGKYSHNADIIIQLTGEEINSWEEDNTLVDPFEIKLGSEIPQISMNLVERFQDTLGKVFDLESMQNSNADKQNNVYMCAKGILKFVNENNEELVYYDEDVLKQLYLSEFQANRYGAKSDYAESVWNYLSSKCYTDGENGIKIYAYEKVDEELIEWKFDDADAKLDTMKDYFNYAIDLGDNVLSNITINRQIISDDYLYKADDWAKDTYDNEELIGKLKSAATDVLGMHGIVDTAIKTYSFQDVDYYSQISKYTTPVEFLVSLLNASSSREFVDAFIEKVATYNEESNYITLKFYRKSKSTSEEVTEVTKEKTEVNLQAIISSINLTGYKNLTVKTEGEGGVVTETTTEEAQDATSVNGINVKCYWSENNKIKIELTNIPEELDRIYVDVKFATGASISDISVPPGEYLKSDPLGTSATRTYEVPLSLITSHTSRTNDAVITQYTTKLTTETNLGVAVEKVAVWYGTAEYQNIIQQDITHESKNSNGEWVDAQVVKETKKVDGKDVEVDVVKPIMINKTKESINVSNKNILVSKSIEGFAVNEVASRVEKWYANLKADEVMFWVTPGGHLTHSLYTRYGDGGLQLCDWDDLLNIRFTYAMQNGPADWWTKKWYTPVSMTCRTIQCVNGSCDSCKKGAPCNDGIGTTGYQIGYLKEIVDRYIVTMVPQDDETEPNVNVFLGLLRNNGIEIEYDNVNGGKINVANRLIYHGGAGWLFDLLGRSPNTQGLVHVMKYILGQYKEGINYGVTEWTFEIFNRKGMIEINS